MSDKEQDLLVACKLALAHLDNYALSDRLGLHMTEIVKAQVVLTKAIRNNGGWR